MATREQSAISEPATGGVCAVIGRREMYRPRRSDTDCYAARAFIAAAYQIPTSNVGGVAGRERRWAGNWAFCRQAGAARPNNPDPDRAPPPPPLAHLQTSAPRPAHRPFGPQRIYGGARHRGGGGSGAANRRRWETRGRVANSAFSRPNVMRRDHATTGGNRPIAHNETPILGRIVSVSKASQSLRLRYTPCANRPLTEQIIALHTPFRYAVWAPIRPTASFPI